MTFKMPFYLQNTIITGKFGLDFIDLEEILNFLHREKSLLIQTQPTGWQIRKLFSSVTSAILYALKTVSKPQPGGQEQPPPGFVNKVSLEHIYSHFLMYYLCLCCATTAKVSSYNRHSIAHKAYNIFYLDLHKKRKVC